MNIGGHCGIYYVETSGKKSKQKLAYNLSSTFCRNKCHCGPPYHLMVSCELGLACRKNFFCRILLWWTHPVIFLLKKVHFIPQYLKKPVYEVSMKANTPLSPCYVPRSTFNVLEQTLRVQVKSHRTLDRLTCLMMSVPSLKWSGI